MLYRSLMKKGSGKTEVAKKGNNSSKPHAIKPEIAEWKAEFPTEEGLYWFYGKRFGNTKLHQDKPPELVVVKVQKIANGVMYVAEGHFMFKSEPTEFFFQKIELPQLPPSKKESGR